MLGQCLCGKVQFQIDGPTPNIYQCHCSQCRKATGSSSNAGTLVQQNNFLWLSGQSTITSFIHDTGYRSDFCSSCGSPVPNRFKDSENYWVPAGLMQRDFNSTVIAHLHLRSRANWDIPPASGKHYDDMPDLTTLEKLLNK